VNLSGHQLREGDFAAVVAEVLNETGFPPALLQIELTESGVIAQDAATVSQLRQLKNLGVSIAIDDFGTGYSALGYLRRFPVDVIKIDARSWRRSPPAPTTPTSSLR
jgi:EAL domain-containing protein (putative c-di-GMP-specific phosphodiesterase class I)